MTGQGWDQLGELGVAFLLSALIGFEREVRQKSAGIRTYTVVGLGAALFMLISKYGFADVLSEGRVTLDPSRVAAQIVSGLGFIGAGIIFVRRDSVRGLTTAASVWLTAAVAAAAGLEVLAVVTTAAYFVAVLALSPMAGRLGGRLFSSPPLLVVDYLDGRGVLRKVLAIVTEAGFTVLDLDTSDGSAARGGRASESVISATLRLQGRADPTLLADRLVVVEGVISVGRGEAGEAP